MNTDKLIARARELAELRARASEGWELNATGQPHLDRVQILRSKCGGCIETKSANVIERQYNLRLAFAAPEMAELLEQLAGRLEKLESWARPIRHIQAMTTESLYQKGGIPFELALREAHIECLEDRLRQIEQLALSMCEHTCDKWPAGKHAPNCPVVELAIEIENEK